MSTKILWIDTETTGTDPDKNGIHQLSGLIQVGNKIVDTFDFFMDPGDVEYNPEAERITGITQDIVQGYPPEFSVYPEFMEVLDKYVDRYNKNDKFMLAGYNIIFDFNMVKKWMVLNKETYYMSYFQPFMLDVMNLCAYATMHRRSEINIMKLEAMCILFGIDIGEAHNSLNDIVATYKLFKKLTKDHIPIKGI